MSTCHCIKGELARAIEALSSRPYGWDGRDALPVRQDALGTLLGSVLGDGQLCLDGVPMPAVELLEDGTVLLAFAMGGRQVDLHVPCKGIVLWKKGLGDGDGEGYSVEGIARLDGSSARPIEPIAEALGWMMRGAPRECRR